MPPPPKPPSSLPPVLQVVPPASAVARGRRESLPRPLTPLIARDQEVAAVSALVRDPAVRLLTLTGPGGVGKTRLAIAAAAQVADDFPDGAVFVDLSPVSDARLVLNAIARCLGLRDIGAELLEDRLLMAIADCRLLLVLDNFEHVVAAAPRVRGVLDVCPDVTMLVTSRVRLRISGEREFTVAPLPLDWPETVADATPVGAARLFVDRAQEIRPDFGLTADTTHAVAEIVRRVDGLPLAIELAAARIKALPPAGLLQRLEQRLPLLSGGARDMPLRQQTMRDTIAWSYDLLDGTEQALFRRLGVFVGGFSLDAAEAVAGEAGEGGTALSSGLAPSVDVLDGITTLIEHSLLRQSDGSDDEPRYQMLETVREYARGCLDASGERAVMERRHAAYFLAFAEGSGPGLIGPDQAEWLGRIEADRANLSAAAHWGFANDADLALRLCSSLRLFYRRHGHLGEGIALLQQELASGAGSPPVRARALAALASLQNLRGDVEAAAANAEEARAVFEQLGDHLGVVEARRRLAVFHLEQWQRAESPDREQLARAQAPWEEELVLRRAVGDHYGVAWALHDLGTAALRGGALDRATSLLEEALPTFEAIGDHNAIAFVLTNLGRAAAQQADHARAATLFRRALAEFHASGDRWGIAYVLEDGAWLIAETGRFELAARILGAAEASRAADGVQLTVAHRVRHDQVVQQARKALGDLRFDERFRQGRATELHAALSEATTALSGDPPSPASETARPLAALGLTPREAEVVRLLAQGMTDREIAEALSISERTAGNHVQHAMQKLGADSRTAAAVFAIRHGLA